MVFAALFLALAWDLLSPAPAVATDIFAAVPGVPDGSAVSSGLAAPSSLGMPGVSGAGILSGRAAVGLVDDFDHSRCF